jgi:DNA-binding transcriptional LysR family regulator
MSLNIQKLATRLSFRQLQVFLSVYQHKNYSRAGELLGLTQPAVSSQVKQLETALGLPLFEYIGRRLYVTTAGEQLAASAHVIFNELQLLQNNLAEMKGQVAGELKLAMVNTAQYVLPHILRGFVEQHADIDIRLRVMGWTETLQRLENNQDDIFVMGVVPQGKSLASLPFLDNEHFAVAAPHHPIHQQTEVSIKDFLDSPLLLREPGSGSRQILEVFCQQQHLPLQATMELGSNDAIKQATIAGLGVAVLPKLIMMAELQLGLLRVIPLAEFPLRRSWCLVYPKNKHLTPAIQAFLAYVKNNIKTIETIFSALPDANNINPITQSSA